MSHIENSSSSFLPSSNTRLWDKGDDIDSVVHSFTVGNDPITDRSILKYDAIASAAHARMLNKIGLLSSEDTTALLACLRDVHEKSVRGEFDIPRALEDCHTAIETYLVNQVGEAGYRIHTGRSRNDQVLVAMRLYLRSSLIDMCELVHKFAQVCAERARRDFNTPMPGFTHMQAAMPSSVGMWLHAYVEWAIEVIAEGLHCIEFINTNPLGVGAGFGVPLGLDRNYTTELLGFDSVQRNPMAVQNSRGRYERKAVEWMRDGMSLLEKLASDLILYSMDAFGFFKIPTAFTTGSSIMPQKRNPDVLELLRARAGLVRGASVELGYITDKLPSSYHRDFQYTKEPVIRSVLLTQESFDVACRVITGLEVNADKLSAAMSSDLYATYDAYRKVRNGTPFREAYREVGLSLKHTEPDVNSLRNDFSMIADTINKELVEASKELDRLNSQLTKLTKAFNSACNSTLGLE